MCRRCDNANVDCRSPLVRHYHGTGPQSSRISSSRGTIISIRRSSHFLQELHFGAHSRNAYVISVFVGFVWNLIGFPQYSSKFLRTGHHRTPCQPAQERLRPFLSRHLSCLLIKSVREQFNLWPTSCSRLWQMWTFAFSAAVRILYCAMYTRTDVFISFRLFSERLLLAVHVPLSHSRL